MPANERALEGQNAVPVALLTSVEARTALLLLALSNESVPVGSGGMRPKPMTAELKEDEPAEEDAALKESAVAVGYIPVTVSGDAAEVLVALVLVPTKTAL